MAYYLENEFHASTVHNTCIKTLIVRKYPFKNSTGVFTLCYEFHPTFPREV